MTRTAEHAHCAWTPRSQCVHSSPEHDFKRLPCRRWPSARGRPGPLGSGGGWAASAVEPRWLQLRTGRSFGLDYERGDDSRGGVCRALGCARAEKPHWLHLPIGFHVETVEYVILVLILERFTGKFFSMMSCTDIKVTLPLLTFYVRDIGADPAATDICSLLNHKNISSQALGHGCLSVLASRPRPQVLTHVELRFVRPSP